MDFVVGRLFSTGGILFDFDILFGRGRRTEVAVRDRNLIRGMKLSPGASIVGLLVFGTACSILAKLIYYAHGPGLYEKDQRFEKPWFQVLTVS